MALIPQTLSAAYGASGSAWEEGPNRVYDRLAEALVETSPLPLEERLVLDAGAGTGAASRAIAARGGRVVAADAAPEMLRVAAASRPPAAAADARALPFADSAFDAVVAAFSLNHLSRPADGLREAGRVTRPGGVVLASAYAEDDSHPVKAAVRSALAEAGWEPPPWYGELQSRAIPALASVDRATAAIRAAGLDGSAARYEIEIPDLTPLELVRWRLGMADAAWFVASLEPGTRRKVEERAIELLGDGDAPLVRRVVFLTATVA